MAGEEQELVSLFGPQRLRSASTPIAAPTEGAPTKISGGFEALLNKLLALFGMKQTPMRTQDPIEHFPGEPMSSMPGDELTANRLAALSALRPTGFSA